MKVVVDCRYLGKSGIGRFLEGILEQLPSNYEYIYLGDKNVINQYSLKGEVIHTTLDPFSFKGLFDKAKEINKYDAFFTPNFIFTYGIKIPVFTTIHDVIFLDYKDSTKGFVDRLIKKYLLKRAVKKSKKIFTVSNFTKKRIAYHFKKYQNKVEVVYTGISKKILDYKIENIKKKNQIIFVGNLKKNKNIIELIKAFKSVKEINKEMELLIVGDNNHKTKDEELNRYLSQPGIRFTGKVDDNELFKIISESKFLVQPSLYEGFGLPPLEALYLNTKPIISSIEVFKEIYENLDVEFYKNIDDLKNKLITSSYENVISPKNHEYKFENVTNKIIKVMEGSYEK